ncbi:MAG: hypothetical protein AB1815_02510 [Bacillota bacterium]
MWQRLHVLVSAAQMAWLRAEAYTKGKSLGGIIRGIIDEAMSQQKKSS